MIIANGCSMASGFECTRQGQQSPEDWEYAWPKQLCNILGTDGINLSRPGQSNWSIAVNTQSILLRELKQRNPSDLLVIIGWTEFTREEFITDDDIFYFNAGFNEFAINGTLDSYLNRSDVQNAYRGWVGRSIDSHMNRFAWTYWGLVNFLKYNNIPYIFFNAISKPYQPKEDFILCVDASRQQTPELWETMFHDSNYLNNTTQYEWLQTHWNNHTVGNGIGQYHWNPTALNAWANHLAQIIKNGNKNDKSF
jgi:hypothetical protein